MERIYTEEERYFKARKRVEKLKEFYGHLTSFILANTALLVINLMTTPENLWFIWPLLGWGIGIVMHGMKVFNYSPLFGKDWEERKIRAFMEAEENKTNFKK